MGLESYDDYIDYPSQPDWKEFEDMKCKLSTIEDYLKGVIDELYNDEELDLMRMEDYLDEIACQVGLKIPDKILRIGRR